MLACRYNLIAVRETKGSRVWQEKEIARSIANNWLRASVWASIPTPYGGSILSPTFSLLHIRRGRRGSLNRRLTQPIILALRDSLVRYE